MGQILVRNVSDHALNSFRMRAKAKGTSLEQEIRALIEREAELTSEEKVAISRRIRSHSKGGMTPLTLDEIREGLE